jgi:hypothetical protein
MMAAQRSTMDPAGGAAQPGVGKRSFIRVTEIWVPSQDRKHLELASGLYGPLTEFRRVSEETHFGYDEGLPGKAWASGHPIVLKNLTNSYFVRGEAAQAAGLTCAVALPIFSGDFLIAVMVLFCGDDREHVGAVEVWHAPRGSFEMSLVDGYYGTADAFEWFSRHTKFMCGIGLPGQVWATGMPVIMADLGRARRFLRWESAERAGLNRGVGIPCGRDTASPWVLTFLSALGTPIARRFEAWVPDPHQDGLVLQSGFCESGIDLESAHRHTVLRKGAGTLGHVWRSGIPAIATDLSAEPREVCVSLQGTTLETMVAMPIIVDATLKAIVAWYL